MSRKLLVNPPRLIAPDQRIKYGALQSIVAMAECAFADLKPLLEGMADRTNDAMPDKGEIDRALMLAWSIVDQADLLRHLIDSEGDRITIKEKTEFMEAVKDVQSARNWMRHIPQRIEGYQSANKPMPPILGALSFAVVIRATVPLSSGVVIMPDDCIEYHTIVLLNTAIERDVQLQGEPFKYKSFRTPIDHIVLQAFGLIIPLEPLIGQMGRLADAMAVGVQRWIDKVTTEYSGRLDELFELMKPAFAVGNVYRMIARRD